MGSAPVMAKEPLPKRVPQQGTPKPVRGVGFVSLTHHGLTDLFQCEITQPANSQPAAFPSKSPTQNVASPRGFLGFFFPSPHGVSSPENQHCNRERFVPLILSLLMPHPLYFHGSINALLRAHECRYFVSLLHSGDSDNFLFRMEKDINRIFNEMTVSTSYT